MILQSYFRIVFQYVVSIVGKYELTNWLSGSQYRLISEDLPTYARCAMGP
jgi:hypothetical protein